MNEENLPSILLLGLAALFTYLTLVAYQKRSIKIGSFSVRREITEQSHPRAFWFFLMVEGFVAILFGATAVYRLMISVS